ncbi:MAG: ATP-binding cassette domain-containing protein, partial [Chloroflexota bacterium]
MTNGAGASAHLRPPRPAALQVRDLHAYYGESHVLQGVELDVAVGEAVALLGRNGAGKTTMIRS